MYSFRCGLIHAWMRQETEVRMMMQNSTTFSKATKTIVSVLILILAACSSGVFTVPSSLPSPLASTQTAVPTETSTLRPSPSSIPTKTPAPTPTLTPEPVGPIEVPANHEKGFEWSYYLYVPSKVSGTHMLVIPNNTGRFDDFSIVKERSRETINSRISMAKELEIPVIVPVFPRFDDESDGTIASQYLGRGTLEKVWQQKFPLIAREDLQLVAMIDDARERLNGLGIHLDEKVFIEGYSASAMFTSRFTILHPDRVQAAVFGGFGWAIAPAEKWENLFLPYPYGTGDIETLTGKPFNLDEFTKVAIFAYMGEKDDNGWALPWYAGTGDDKNYYSLFKQLFGSTTQQLFDAAEEIYKTQGCSTTFVMYKDQDHNAAYMSHEIDILDFFKEQN
jgi:hypothetical protein